jgi:beta-lysine 5,6-aminomutase beta subunit
MLAGGPRISHEVARELGYDAGFGAGTTPDQVATYIVKELVRRTKGVPA